MRTFSEAYRGKKVLVTGLTGFKGQWLGKWLNQLGADVTGCGLLPAADPLNSMATLAQQFRTEILDIRDSRAVDAHFARYQPQIVFHLAAQALVRPSFEDPVETFGTNVMGTVHVLDAARRHDCVEAVVNVTSDKCYENREWHWPYRENEAMGGYDPYSASKGCSELITAAYRSSYADPRDLAIATGRAGNVIGGGDWSADRLVPDIVRALIDDRPIVLRRPESVRPWQHVLDALSGYLQLGAALLVDRQRYAAAWNFGPEIVDAVPVRQLAQAIVAQWGQGHIVEEPVPTGPHEAKMLKLDSSKAHSELHWRPMLDMQERIEWTVDWYRHCAYQPIDAWKKMDEQIAVYQTRWNQWNCQHRSSLPASPVVSDLPSRVA